MDERPQVRVATLDDAVARAEAGRARAVLVAVAAALVAAILAFGAIGGVRAADVQRAGTGTSGSGGPNCHHGDTAPATGPGAIDSNT
jgi:hypothetical protein